MMRSRLFLPVVALLLGAVILGVPNHAHATFQIRASVDNGATWKYATDEGAGDAFVGVPGFINGSFFFSNVTLFVTVGQSKPITGNPGTSLIDVGINGSFVAAGSPFFGIGGSVIVDISDTGFTSPASPSGPGILTASLGGGGMGTLPANTQFTAYANGGPGGNLLYGGIDPTTGSVFWTPTATVSSPTTFASVPSPNLVAPYSLSARTTFSGAAGSTFSIDNHLTYTNPAPAGLVLALTGVPVLGLRAWFRRRRSVATVA